MLAHGFTIEQMVELIHAGLATAPPECMVAGGRQVEVAHMRITEAGAAVARDTGATRLSRPTT